MKKISEIFSLTYDLAFAGLILLFALWFGYMMSHSQKVNMCESNGFGGDFLASCVEADFGEYPGEAKPFTMTLKKGAY